MKVLKFGGSSVGTPERIKGLIEILKNYYTRGEKFTVVFSAFGGVTDSLIEMSSLRQKEMKAYKESFHQLQPTTSECYRLSCWLVAFERTSIRRIYQKPSQGFKKSACMEFSWSGKPLPEQWIMF